MKGNKNAARGETHRLRGEHIAAIREFDKAIERLEGETSSTSLLRWCYAHRAAAKAAMGIMITGHGSAKAAAAHGIAEPPGAIADFGAAIQGGDYPWAEAHLAEAHRAYARDWYSSGWADPVHHRMFWRHTHEAVKLFRKALSAGGSNLGNGAIAALDEPVTTGAGKGPGLGGVEDPYPWALAHLAATLTAALWFYQQRCEDLKACSETEAEVLRGMLDHARVQEEGKGVEQLVFEEAHELFDRAIAAQGQYPWAAQMRTLLYAVAASYPFPSRASSAPDPRAELVQAAKDALAHGGESRLFQRALALALCYVHDPENAIAAADQLLARDSEDIRVHAVRAAALAQKLEEKFDALEFRALVYSYRCLVNARARILGIVAEASSALKKLSHPEIKYLLNTVEPTMDTGSTTGMGLLGVQSTVGDAAPSGIPLISLLDPSGSEGLLGEGRQPSQHIDLDAAAFNRLLRRK